ncbi:MAG: hypothetical protein K2O16_10590 [Lachnospiraceae bacterium]|nr:hypothetical protein [Lachnospiraceae bacterium]
MENVMPEQKTEAVKRMHEIGIASHIIQVFEESGIVSLSEDGEFLHRLDEDEQKMVDNFEKEYQCLVYHVLKSTGNLGFVYTFLIVTRNSNDWRQQLAPHACNGETATRAFAYVINDAWKCREFGDVVINVDAEGCVGQIL